MLQNKTTANANGNPRSTTKRTRDELDNSATSAAAKKEHLEGMEYNLRIEVLKELNMALKEDVLRFENANITLRCLVDRISEQLQELKAENDQYKQENSKLKGIIERILSKQNQQPTYSMGGSDSTPTYMRSPQPSMLYGLPYMLSNLNSMQNQQTQMVSSLIDEPNNITSQQEVLPLFSLSRGIMPPFRPQNSAVDNDVASRSFVLHKPTT